MRHGNWKRRLAMVSVVMLAGMGSGAWGWQPGGGPAATERAPAADKPVTIVVKAVPNDNPANRTMEHATLDASLRNATLADLMKALDEALVGVNAVYDVPDEGRSVRLPDMTLKGVSGRLLINVVMERVNSQLQRQDGAERLDMQANQNVYRFYFQPTRPTMPVNMPAQLMGPSATDFIAVGPLLDALNVEHGKDGVAVLMSALEEGLKPMPHEAQGAELKLHGPSSLLIVRGTTRQTQNAQTIVRRLSEQAVAKRTQAAIGPEALAKLRADLDQLAEHGRVMLMELQSQKDEGRRMRIQGDIDEINWQIESVRRQIETIQMLRLTRPLVLPGVDSANPFVPGPPTTTPQSDPLIHLAPTRPGGNRPAK